ncbi:MAG: VOC family protein [Gemmatimonadaceae bacterium]
MSSVTIHPDTLVGPVALAVSELDRSERFYHSVIGLETLQREGDVLSLGIQNEVPLLELTERPAARRVPPRTTGLYHFAILVPTRMDLAHALRRIAVSGWPLSGSSDHLVSEALYLSDPDGNGIEIYRDRPRSEWKQRDGRIEMTLDPLDLRALLAEVSQSDHPQAQMPAGTIMGHVHLRVADLRLVREFYNGTLGFDITNDSFPGALFVSAGGYHHHLGLNTWGSEGAPAPPSDALGLGHFTVRLPDQAELDRVAERVRRSGIAVKETSDGLLVRDPSGNGVLLGIRD